MNRAFRWLLVLAVALMLIAAACGAQPSAADLAPTPGPGVTRTQVTPSETDIIFLETVPVQVRLVVEGVLPNPCSRLGWYVKPGDDQGRIEVALFADQTIDVSACTRSAVPYSEPIPIGTFERGSFVVILNGQIDEDFTVP